MPTIKMLILTPSRYGTELNDFLYRFYICKVYTSFQLARKYIHYYLTASNGKGHGIHSPFVFNFVLDVLNNRKNIQPPANIEALRKELLQDDTALLIEDMGAGSRANTSTKRTVKEITKSAVKPKKYGQLLHRLVNIYQPENIIELGTSLGITASYLAAGNVNGTVITIEGAPAIQGLAISNFKKLHLSNIESLQGNFDEVLPAVLNEKASIDLVYVDGNHRYQPTINYFNQLLTKINNDTILIFDDIHWSKEMEQAWEEIQHHSLVTCTIDIFFMGFVIFRKEVKKKQQFIIRF
ncbi:MAG: class I SAM-dependent methyltransferase [Bacteroidota bacterium]|nr:class I SAM-dependent methyltransferase [Bacteroidota bacterium]